MKYNIPLAVVASLVILISPLPLGRGLEGSVDSGGQAESWLMLIYMAADNNLGENESYGNAAWFDIEEIEGNMSTESLDVLILNDMKGDHNTRLYDLSKHPAPGIGSPTIPLSDVNPSWGDELRTSDWRVLRDFIVYGVNSGSHDRIMLDIWDHGTGWYTTLSTRSPGTRGFAQDVTDGGTMLLDGLRSALTEASSQLGGLEMDVISFDTCYMATMEVMYQVSPWADYGLGVQEQQPFYGMNYTFTSEMGVNTTLTPETLVEKAVDLYAGTYTLSIDPWAGLTAVNLTILSRGLLESLDDLARNLTGRIYHLEVEESGKFYQAYLLAERIGGSSTRIDLGDLLKWIYVEDMDPTITRLSGIAWEQYNSTILREFHFEAGNNPDATGLNIYFPPGGYNSKYDGSSGFLDFTADTWWDQLVREFQDPVERVRINTSIVATGQDGLENDLLVNVTNPSVSEMEPVTGASVFLDGDMVGPTSTEGTLIIPDLPPDRYDLRVENGTWLGYAQVKMLNRPPVIVFKDENLTGYESEPILIDASDSYDPDGDRITYKWDLDASDGLDDVDSTLPGVSLTYEEEGEYLISLRIGDGMEIVRENISVSVKNRPPIARIYAPMSAREDEIFLVDAYNTTDSPVDMEVLLYSFSLDGENITDWTDRPWIKLSIPESGHHTIGLNVRDPKGAVSNNLTGIDIFNVWPHPELIGPDKVREDELFEIVEKGKPDTQSDQSTLRYNWYLDGDDVGENRSSLEISIPFSGQYNISLKITDDDGSSGRSWHVIDVVNSPPTAIIYGPVTAVEGETLTFLSNGSIDTPGDKESLSYQWDVGADGTFEYDGPSISIKFDDVGIHSLLLKVTDDDGAFDQHMINISVENIPPSPTILGPSVLSEDEKGIYTIDENTDSKGDIQTLSCRWLVDGVLYSTEESLSVIFISSGYHTIRLEVSDDQNDEGWDSVTVLVENPRPVAVIESDSREVEVGEEFTIRGWRSEDNPSDLFTLEFIWMLDGEMISSGSPNLTISIDDEGDHYITLRVKDDDGSVNESRITIRVFEANGPRILGLSYATLLLILAPLMVVIIGLIIGMRKKVHELPRTPEERFDGEIDEQLDEMEFGEVVEGPENEETEEIEPEDEEIEEIKDDVEMEIMVDKEEIEEMLAEKPDTPSPPEIEDPDPDMFQLPPDLSGVTKY